MTGVAAADVGASPAARAGSTSARPRPRTASTVRLRRPPPVHEARDAAHPPRADPVPRRRGRHVAASATSRVSSSRGRVADGPADRDAATCCSSRTSASRRPASRPAGRPTSRPTSPSTRTAQEIARKTIRVNDPLSVGGYTFHQNGFGPAPHLVIRDAGGRPLWDAQVPMTDVGRRVRRTDDGRARAATSASSCCSAATPTATGVARRAAVPDRRHERRRAPTRPRTSRRSVCAAATTSVSDAARHLGRPAPISASTRCSSPSGTRAGRSSGPRSCRLIAGIAITFYLPRRRVWARLDADGGSAIVCRSDRYVDVEREFGRLLDDLVAVRRAAA